MHMPSSSILLGIILAAAGPTNAQTLLGLDDGSLAATGPVVHEFDGSCTIVNRCPTGGALGPNIAYPAGGVAYDPTDGTTTMGPLADPTSADTMERQVEEARSGGANVVLGGRRTLIAGATFFEPTLVLHPTAEMKIMREENFGPIMPVVRVADDDEALARINDCDFGLTAALFTTSTERAERMAAAIEAGTVYMNRCDYLDPALPWTGYKQSGRGSGRSRFAFYGLTKRKSLHFKP